MSDQAHETILDHPGFLGFTSRGVIAIHAEWPIYPVDHGLGSALRGLASYPLGTRFRLIDDIDRCALLVAEDFLVLNTNVTDSRNWHVAAWHEDLLEAADAGYVTGVERLTEREYDTRRREELREAVRGAARSAGADLGTADPLSLLRVEIDGEGVPLALPDELDDGGEEDFLSEHAWLGTHAGGPIVLTATGLTAIEQLIAADLVIPDLARERLDHLLERGQFDTAIRELGAYLETEMRAIVGDPQAYGLRLVESYVGALESSGTVLAAHLKILRAELRTCLKFIRNGFAHAIVDLERPRALALISRLSDSLATVSDVSQLRHGEPN